MATAFHRLANDYMKVRRVGRRRALDRQSRTLHALCSAFAWHSRLALSCLRCLFVFGSAPAPVAWARNLSSTSSEKQSTSTTATIEAARWRFYFRTSK